MAFTSDTAAEAGKSSTRKGVKNKSTAELKALLQTVLENNLETLENDLKAMEPTERVKAILSLANYLLPKCRAIDISDTTNTDNFKPVVIKPKEWI